MNYTLIQIPLEPKHWRYKNEGALHIILEYCGTHDQLSLVHRVV